MRQEPDRLHKRHWTTQDGLTLIGDVVIGVPGAPTIVLLHGGGQTRHSWRGAVAALASVGYHVINYDARGHGESDWSCSGDYWSSAHAADLAAVISGVAGPIGVVGASMGGVTLMRALATGFRPVAAALVDIVLRPELQGVDRVRDFMTQGIDGFPTIEDVAAAVSHYNPHRKTSADRSGLMRNLRLREDGRYYWHWDPALLKIDPDIEADEIERDLAGLCEEASVALLLVRGAQSDLVSDRCITDMTNILPCIEVAGVGGAGHMVAGDRNDAFNEAVISFLSRTLPSAKPPSAADSVSSRPQRCSHA